MNREQYIVVFGNLADGFEYIGPFVGSGAALAYGDKHLHPNGDWCIIMLQEPAKIEVDAFGDEVEEDNRGIPHEDDPEIVWD